VVVLVAAAAVVIKMRSLVTLRFLLIYRIKYKTSTLWSTDECDDNVKITRSVDPVFRVLVFYAGGSLYDLATNLHPPHAYISVARTSTRARRSEN